MLGWLYDMFMAFVTFILSLLGVSAPSDKKSVTFAEDTKEPAETPLTQDAISTQLDSN